MPGPMNLKIWNPNPIKLAVNRVKFAMKSSSNCLSVFHLQMYRYFMTKIPSIRNRNPLASPPLSVKLTKQIGLGKGPIQARSKSTPPDIL